MSAGLDKQAFLKNIESLLQDVLAIDTLNIPITLETQLVNGVGENRIDLSSIDYVFFLVAVEDFYNITFDFDAKVFTVNDVYSYIVEYKEKERFHT